jgi:hypothetical protein
MLPVKTIGLMSGTPSTGWMRRSSKPTASRSPTRARAFIGPIRDPKVSCCEGRSPMLWGPPTEGRAPGGPAQPNSLRPMRLPSNACSRSSASIAPKSRSLVPWSDRAASSAFAAHGPDWRRTSVGTPARDPRCVRFPGWRAGRRWCHDTSALPQPSIGRTRPQSSTSAACPGPCA